MNSSERVSLFSRAKNSFLAYKNGVFSWIKLLFIPSVPVAQTPSNIKKYLQDWDKNINFMECKARKNIRRNYSQVFS